ncbi:amidinotransferase [Microtetraspora sp. NBRC 13810]|uniref:dimethylargininase n=1 Tax=Microtetraspora sp. NBRC 13810 TaxID=3030990 RepID=UPI0024A3F1F3|nr:dimethylargininase [Microtetraspora sp. NBRC 13810]GLW08630.1 amidinotransferase [Microtetraspora sp. NBRC 13810]
MTPTRHYLMCRPDHFSVDYAINPWMDPGTGADRDIAVRQWEGLKAVYEELGHSVSLIDPVEGLPDMVFAANGALVVDGRVYGARFTYPERAPEAGAYLRWFAGHGYETKEASFTNEGEGDFLVMADVILAGTGFRTDVAAHKEAQEFFGRPVVTLQLVDPRFYHLDTALFPLDDGRNAAYYPGAFSPGSEQVLRRLFPEAVLASAADAAVLGLNAVSDGRNVVVNSEAAELQLELKRRGYEVIPVDMSELRKAGGGPKCCTLEIRS